MCGAVRRSFSCGVFIGLASSRTEFKPAFGKKKRDIIGGKIEKRRSIIDQPVLVLQNCKAPKKYVHTGKGGRVKVNS